MLIYQVGHYLDVALHSDYTFILMLFRMLGMYTRIVYF